MTPQEIESFHRRSPGRRLGMLHRLSMAYMTCPLADMGLTKGRIGFLITVLQHEGIVQEDLSNLLFIDPAATARALKHLESDGLVRRDEDPEDRRRKLVYSTARARALQPELMAMLTRYNEALFDGLDREAQDRFLDMLDRLVANLRKGVEDMER
ncbi:MAG: MarR family transcriptional regulator [Desulfovibrionaceae bacterium]|nr:MarR family transcriptional regulator [Desulfovibrionaceae bacterium]